MGYTTLGRSGLRVFCDFAVQERVRELAAKQGASPAGLGSGFETDRLHPGISRRGFLRAGLTAAGALAVGAGGALVPDRALAGRHRWRRGAIAYGPLQAPDANGLRLPAGFTSRIVAESGLVVPGTGHVWHAAPDGGANFSLPDGGWVYVSNAELSSGGGGVGALRFEATGDVVDAYTILSGTTRNCAGGPTPWGTWLSCEETSSGHVFECDPTGVEAPVMHSALGTFKHEAAAVDPFHGRIYLTEDRSDGLLYRFTPDAFPDLSSGILEAAEAIGGDPFSTRPLAWHEVPNPNPSGSQTATRDQVPAATTFRGGEAPGTNRARSTSRRRATIAYGSSTPSPTRSASSTTGRPR